MQILEDTLWHAGGIISRRQHPELATRIDSAVRRGTLTRVLPGVYVHADLRRDWRAHAQAACLWHPDAIVTGDAAAALTFWPRTTPQRITVATRQARFTARGYSFTTRHVPPDLVTTIDGIRITRPELTAIDLVPRYGGDPIDDVLRERMATLAGLYRALGDTPRRAGNTDRHRMLIDSRAEPWSRGERLAHRHLRAAGVTRWKTNVKIICQGHTFFQDITLDDSPIVAEIDGRVHLRRSQFEHDRRRGNYLLLAGKQVLHYTYAMLTDEPDWFISTLRQALARYR